MKLLSKIMPTRSDAQANTRLVADIDKIVAEPVGFMLLGRVRILKPITTEEFLEFTKAYNNLAILAEKEKVTPADYIFGVYRVFKTVCDDISKKDLRKMSHVQIGAVHSLIMRSISGEIFTESQEDFEKKTLGQLSAVGIT